MLYVRNCSCCVDVGMTLARLGVYMYVPGLHCIECTTSHAYSLNIRVIVCWQPVKSVIFHERAIGRGEIGEEEDTHSHHRNGL